MTDRKVARLLPRRRMEGVARRILTRDRAARPLNDSDGSPIPYPDLEIEPDDYIVTARDDKGASVQNRYWCTPLLNSLMDEIVACRKFPFRTKADYVRWACSFCLHVLEGKMSEPVVAQSLAILDAANRMLAAQETLAEAGKFIADAPRAAAALERAFGAEHALKHVRQVMNIVARIPDEGIRARCMAELQIVADKLAPLCLRERG